MLCLLSRRENPAEQHGTERWQPPEKGRAGLGGAAVDAQCLGFQQKTQKLKENQIWMEAQNLH